MSTKSVKKGVVYDPGKCRCCGATKKCRLLNTEYEYEKKKEVYTDMFVECFGLVLSHLDGEPTDRLICAMCVGRLREACAFRSQVLQCEEKLLQARIQVHDAALPIGPAPMEIKTEVEIKEEVLDDDDVVFYDNGLSNNITEDKVTAPPKKVTDRNNLKDQKELLLKIQKMKSRLKLMQHSKKLQKPIITRASVPKFIDEDSLAFQNNLTIIENSYVCPFQTAYSTYFCPYCKASFTDPEKLREHNLTHDPKLFKHLNSKKPTYLDIKRIDCRLCDKKITKMADFRTHITEVHKITLNNVKDELLKFKLTDSTLTCIECDQSFLFFHALKRHMAVHFGAYVCDVCGEHFFEKSVLDQHHRNSHGKGEAEYSCHECGKLFKKKIALTMHLSSVHKKEPAFQCMKCEVLFYSTKERIKHMREVHNVIRTQTCETCGKSYDNRSHLREHVRAVHLRVFRHKCVMCRRGFAQPQRLQDHIATVHRTDKQFFCDICGNSYPRLSILKQHIMSHSNTP